MEKKLNGDKILNVQSIFMRWKQWMWRSGLKPCLLPPRAQEVIWWYVWLLPSRILRG